MNGERFYVSVVEPLTPAIERVKTILFRPFDLGKWFVIGFCAWLAELGRQPKGGGSGRGGGGHGGGRMAPFHKMPPDLKEIMDWAREEMAAARAFVEANLHWIIPVAIVVAVIAIILWILLMWLSSRGRFMFLHCVVENKAEVAVPWNKFSRHANSLFVFRVVVGLINITAVAVAVFAGIMLFAGAARVHSGTAAAAIAVSVFVSMIALAIIMFLIQKFTTDFVVPIMFLRATSCTAAWGQFLSLFSANTGRFVLYLLFQIVIHLVIGMLVLAAVCVTCCCAGCILGLPYIGTVLYLPVLIFHRSYSLYYLQQYGQAYDVFGAVEQAVSPS